MRGLTLIHGFTGSPASFDDLLWRLRSRDGRLRAFRPALLGHGGHAPRDLRRFEQEVDRLAAEIVRGQWVGQHLCGYSLGARVALGLLARHAYLFSGATLIGVHPGLASLGERVLRVGSDERWCDVLRTRGMAAFLDAWQAQPLFASQRQLPEAVACAQRRVRAGHTADGLMRSLRVLGLGQMPDYRGALHDLPLRVRLVAGERDVKFATLARSLHARARCVELDLVPGVGHNVLLEAPEHVENILIRALVA